MNCMTAPQIIEFKGRNGNAVGLQIAERGAQEFKILWLGEDSEVRVAAKLRRAVKHAGLPAHQQGADLAGCHRRKDFAYRVRDQASLPSANRPPRVSGFPASVPAA